MRSAISKYRIIRFYGKFLKSGEHRLNKIKNKQAIKERTAGVT